MTGVGFLGAGMIFVRNQTISGLTGGGRLAWRVSVWHRRWALLPRRGGHPAS
ncbi:MAG: hypothetical protein ACLSAH_07120 [Bilophila wadsworthia]